jgi:hypothetical protein
MRRVGIKYRGDKKNSEYVVVHAVAPGVGDSDSLCKISQSLIAYHAQAKATMANGGGGLNGKR